MTNPNPDQPRMSVPEAEAALAPLEAAVRDGREAQPTETDEQRADREETERDHARGDHTYCGITCEVELPTEHLRNFVIAKGYPGTKGALDELLRRAAASAAPTAAGPSTDRVAASAAWVDGHPQLETIAAAVWQQCRTADHLVVDDPRAIAVAALTAMRAQQTGDRAALRDAADWYAQQGKTVLAASQVAADLHRRAGGDAPLSPYYEHPECGFHWHGRDGMDIPMRDGQPVCPRCELRRLSEPTDQAAETPLEKRLRFSERRNDELRTECKRRGKRVLEQSEQILALERQLDEVRRQLGEEILRAGQAEAEAERLRADHAAVRTAALREAADRLWALADRTTERGAGVLWVADWLRRLADEAQGTTPDTLPEWLHWRFGPHGQPWSDVPDADKALWEHQARAVRRAVARGGFKRPAGPAAPAKEA